MAKRKRQQADPRDVQKSAREIAEHVAAIISHPDTPDELYDGIIRSLHELDDNTNVHARPGYVEAILLTHFEDEQKGRKP